MNRLSFYLKSARVFILLVILLQGCGYSQTTSSDTVCITRTGAKFHLCDCRYLSRSSYEITRKEAITRGYTACSVCRPDDFEKEEVETETYEASEPAGASHSASPRPTPQKTKQQTAQPSQSGSQQCTAYTQKGARCKRTTTSANGKCWQHQ